MALRMKKAHKKKPAKVATIRKQPTLEVMEDYAKKALKKWAKVIKKQPRLSLSLEYKKFDLQKLDTRVSVTLVSTSKITKLNAQYRKKKKPTDVLSFPAPTVFWEHTLGEIVIGAPVCLKQAKEQNHSWKKELDVLLVHGLLHLLGYDHEKSKKDEVKMRSLEAKILGKSAQPLTGRY